MPFEFEKQRIDGVILVKPKVFGDKRGFLWKLIRNPSLQQTVLMLSLIRIIILNLQPIVLRGLHYQAEPYGQAKLVRCVRGRIYDVAVDLRLNSKNLWKVCKS